MYSYFFEVFAAWASGYRIRQCRCVSPVVFVDVKSVKVTAAVYITEADYNS